MHNHSRKSARIRRIKRLRDSTLEHVAWIVVFVIFAYLFFYGPLAASMGWSFALWD